MLKNGIFHNDLGADHFDRRSRQTKAAHLAKQIAKLGSQVTLQPAAVMQPKKPTDINVVDKVSFLGSYRELARLGL